MTASAVELDLPVTPRSRRRSSVTGILGVVILAVLVVTSVLAPVLVSYSPLEQDLGAVLQPPSALHWFGTDELGRDLFSRVLYGGRTALSVTLIASVIAALIGIVLGLAGALIGGWVDVVAGRLADVQLAIPTIVLALVILSFVGNSIGPLLIVLVAGSWVLTFRVIRGHAQSVVGQPYIEAARLSGLGRVQIAVRHLLPSVLPLFVVAFTLNASAILLLESSLGFLGLGVQPPTADWGAMVAQGQARLDSAPWVALFPGAVLILAVVSFQLIGDALADRFGART
ncbi:ABC transporter permease [Rhodococcoides kyotonense]|uniref:Peptide/nickel transport system permease protein n=1 Tax=Rhodococcoides kyotonense TaxID=398843 RepID=A0A239G9Y5_9NOCA|nr:ABC transporter permease [Rhodococcus kyotonensis]SNS65977.1 peptide/nickel transport system permease protein [Rhodococcus kyotonensis]